MFSGSTVCVGRKFMLLGRFPVQVIHSAPSRGNVVNYLLTCTIGTKALRFHIDGRVFCSDLFCRERMSATGIGRWQVTCRKKDMKQENEGIRPYSAVSAKPRGTGPDSAGQSGDTQGLSDVAEAGSES